MKKAKLLLSAIAILAVVGTGLAFKAQKELKVLWTGTEINKCFRTISVTTTNDNTKPFLYTTAIGPEDPLVPTTCVVKTFVKTTIN